MRFFDLKNKPDYIPTIAYWFHQEWSHLNPERSLDDVIGLIHQTIESSSEKIFIGISKEKAVSSVTLRINELKHEKDFSPWLSSLVVDKPHRKKGIGGKTIQFFVNYCKMQGIDKIYLFTENLHDWYNQHGWQKIKRSTFKGHDGDIMVCKI